MKHFKDNKVFKKAIKYSRAIINHLGVKKYINPIYKSILIGLRDRKALKEFEKIIANTGRINKSDIYKTKSILHFYPAIINEYPLYFNLFIDKALVLRGVDLDIIVCMGTMEFCTTCVDINSGINKSSCRKCKKYGPKIMKKMELPYKTYFNYIDEGVIQKHLENTKRMDTLYKDYKYKGVNVGFHSWTSADRYFLGYLPNKEELLRIYKIEMVNAMITVDVAEAAFNNKKYDALIMQHGIYASWGSFIDYFRNKGIKCYMIDASGYHDSKIVFDSYLKEDNYSKYLETRKQVELTQQEESELDEFLYKRMNFIAYNTDIVQLEYQNKLPKEYFDSLKDYKKVIGLFTNLQWEGGLIGANICFEGIYNWVDYSIELAKKRKDIKLIIKPHPWDQHSYESVDDYIKKKYPDLPKNITVLSPQLNLKAYELFEYIDYGIVCTGTLGLEMSLKGIPVITVGRGHYRGKGFTFDALDKISYEKYYLNESLVMTENMKKKVREYAYYYFIKTFIDFPIIDRFGFYNDFIIKDLHILEPGKNRYIDHICSYLAGEKKVLQDW